MIDLIGLIGALSDRGSDEMHRTGMPQGMEVPRLFDVLNFDLKLKAQKAVAAWIGGHK